MPNSDEPSCPRRRFCGQPRHQVRAHLFESEDLVDVAERAVCASGVGRPAAHPNCVLGLLGVSGLDSGPRSPPRTRLRPRLTMGRNPVGLGIRRRTDTPSGPLTAASFSACGQQASRGGAAHRMQLHQDRALELAQVRLGGACPAVVSVVHRLVARVGGLCDVKRALGVRRRRLPKGRDQPAREEGGTPQKAKRQTAALVRGAWRPPAAARGAPRPRQATQRR